MIRKFGSAEVAFANLTLHDNFWAISLDMLEQLGPSHVLEVFMVADVAAKFGTFVHRMLLQLEHGLPDDDLATILPALVWELAKVNAIAEDLVDWLEEVAALLAIWAAHFVAWSDIPGASDLILLGIDAGSVLLSLCWRHLGESLLGKLVHLRISIVILVMDGSRSHQLFLAVLAEKFVALLAFLRREWEVEAHDALDFFNHFSLQLVGNHRHFNVESWNWLGSHDLFDSFIGDQKGKLLTLAIDFMTGAWWTALIGSNTRRLRCFSLVVLRLLLHGNVR